MFPTHRPRRLRSHAQLRRMVSETVLTINDLTYHPKDAVRWLA
ncbi:MAG: hypothetical protein AAF915_01175 [Cyanobacteria bacterium P01_D01_bin.50]